jgi:hypothetical protein
MFRKYEPSPQTYNNYLQDSALTPISTYHSVFNGLMEGIGGTALMGQEVASVLTGVPMVSDDLKNMLEVFQRENNYPTQSNGQIIANSLANLIGSGLGTGYMGKIAGRGLGMVFGKAAQTVLPEAFTNFTKKPLTQILSQDLEQYLPKAASEEGQKIATVGEFGSQMASSYGMGAGFVLPQAVMENYDEKANTLNWGGVAKESLGYGGALGLAIDVFPYTAGVIWGKTKGFLTEAEKMPMPGHLQGIVPHEVLSGEESGAQYHPMLDAAWKAHQNGKITLDEYKWWRDYLVNPTNLESLRTRGVSILMKDGHPVDPGKLNVMLQLMKPEDTQSFVSGVADQLGSAVDEQADSALSDYVVNNGLDRIQSDPKLLSGLQGFYDFIQNKLAQKPEHMGRVQKMKDSGLEHINNTNPFSPKMIYTAIKNGAKNLAHTIPEHINRRLKQEERISDLEKKRDKYLGSVPTELVEAKKSTESEFTKASKARDKAQRKLDRSIEKLGEHEAKITEMQEKRKTEQREKKQKELDEKLESAEAKRDEFAETNRKLAQEVKLAKAHESNAKAKLAVVKKRLNEHQAQLAKQGKSTQHLSRLEKVEAKLEKLRNELEPILHPDDELAHIEKSLVKDDGIPKNFRSMNEYQRLHDLAQISPRARTLLHYIDLLREYEKQEGYKHVADVILQLADKGFRKLADGDRVVSYLKKRIESSTPELNMAKSEAIEPVKEPQVPQDAEKVLEEQGREQKTESEMHKEAYDESKAKFDEFKKSENIFKNFIQCVMGSTNV